MAHPHILSGTYAVFLGGKYMPSFWARTYAVISHRKHMPSFWAETYAVMPEREIYAAILSEAAHALRELRSRRTPTPPELPRPPALFDHGWPTHPLTHQHSG